jgi:hypothetical protein
MDKTKDVDARHKAGHDAEDGCAAEHCSYAQESE